MNASDLHSQADRDYAQRTERSSSLHHFYKSRTSHARDKGDSMPETKKKAAAKKVEKPETWGSKDMAKAVNIEPKKLRRILRASGKGVTANGELGRYTWKPNDKEAIAKIKKLIEEAEKEEAKKEAPKAAKKAAPKKSAPKKKAPPKKEEEPAEEEVETPDAEEDDEDMFEGEGEAAEG